MPNQNQGLIDAYDFDGVAHKVPVSVLSWRPGAYGIVIKDDCVLLLRQTNGYDLPGGGVDFGETLEGAVIREVKEETGLDVVNPQIVGAGTGFYLPFKQGVDQAKQALQFYYVCDYVGGKFSTTGFDPNEQIYAEAPEWVPLKKLDDIKIGTTIDFRPHIKKALTL